RLALSLSKGVFGLFCKREGEALRGSWDAVWPMLLCLTVSACARDRVVPVYDAAGAIRRLDYDTNRDGRIEMRTYLVDGRPARLEADGNGDDVIDRWEYYGADGSLSRIGTSSASDGREDTWIVRNGDQVRMDISTRRNGVADRHEY